jgi:hypothetical protein
MKKYATANKLLTDRHTQDRYVKDDKTGLPLYEICYSIDLVTTNKGLL